MKPMTIKAVFSMLLALAMVLSLGSIIAVTAESASFEVKTIDLFNAEPKQTTINDLATELIKGNGNNGEGDFARMNASQAGAAVTFAFAVDKASDYDLTIRFRAHESTGLAEVKVNGVSIGTLDARTTNGLTANKVYETVYPNIPFAAGVNTVEVIATEKGKSGFGVNIYKFTLIETDKSTMGGTMTPYGVTTLFTTGKETQQEFKTDYTGADYYSGDNGKYWCANWSVDPTIYCYNITDGSYFGYDLTVEKEGYYDLEWFARGHNSSYGTFSVYVGGLLEENLVKSGLSTYYKDGTKLVSFDLGAVKLSAGANRIYFVSEATGKGYNTFVSYKVTATEGTIITPEYYTAGYLSSRVNTVDPQKHDLRIVLVSELAKLESHTALTATITFQKGDSVVKTHTGTLGQGGDGNFLLYRTVIAAGKTYQTTEDYAIFGAIITDIPADAWDTVTVTVNGDGNVISQGSGNYTDLVG